MHFLVGFSVCSYFLIDPEREEDEDDDKEDDDMTMPMPLKLSDHDLATLSGFDYVSEESLAALSRLQAGTRRIIIQSCTNNPNFDDVDLYYLAMSELSEVQVEAEAATVAAVVVAGSADHQDAGEPMINMEPPEAAAATSNNCVPKGRRSNNRIRRTAVTFPVAMKDHRQKMPVHSDADSDTLQRPPFNVIETRASLSRSFRPTIPTLFDHVCRKLQNLAIDIDQERATTTTMIAKRTTKKRVTTNVKGKATGRWGPSTSNTTDERIESQRSITALLTKLVALTESPPPASLDQVCHNQEITLAIPDECVKTMIKKTKIRVPLKKRAIDFEYQEKNSSTTAKKRVIKLETATEAPPTTPAPPKVCYNKETTFGRNKEITLAITDDDSLTVEKAEKAYGMERAIDFEYSDEEDLYKASTSSKKRVIKKKKNTLENNVVQLPHLPPDMPVELRERIIALHGTDPVLVIQKALYSTDVNPVQCRLSLPVTKVNPEFLSPEEMATLATRHGREVPEIKVQLIEPSRHVREMSLKKWDMKKGSGTVNSTYNLVSGWNDVVRDNDLQAGMIMQLWSFQVGLRRWFALVKVESDEGH